MEPAIWDEFSTIYRGTSSYSETFTLFEDNVAEDGNEFDLTGHTVDCELRTSYDKDSDLIATFTCTVSTPASSGEITISLTKTETGAISSDYSKGYFGVRVTNDATGKSDPWMKGPIDISDKFPTGG